MALLLVSRQQATGNGGNAWPGKRGGYFDRRKPFGRKPFGRTSVILTAGNLSVERAYDARLSSAYAAGQFPDLQRRVQNVTAIISRSSIVAFCLVVSVSTSTNAEIANAIDKASGDSSFIIAQTEGMERREDRRDNRQDAREEGGLIGKDKRDAKQEGRQEGPRKRKRKRARARQASNHRASEGGVGIRAAS